MWLEKRESTDFNIYYIYERFDEIKDTIIGFVMETKDRGLTLLKESPFQVIKEDAQ